MSAPEIVVVGNATVDFFVRGTVYPPSDDGAGWPSPGARLVVLPRAVQTFWPGGNGVNVAAGLASLGRTVLLICGMNPKDVAGKMVVEGIGHLPSLQLQCLARPGQETPISYCIGDGEAEPSFFCLAGASCAVDPEALYEAHARGVFATAKWLVVVGLGLLPGLDPRLHELRELFQELRARGTRIAVDVNLVCGGSPEFWGPLKELLPFVDVATPNVAEGRQILGAAAARELAGQGDPEAKKQRIGCEAAKNVGQELSRLLPDGLAVVKCDRLGCVVTDSREGLRQEYVTAKKKKEVRDTVGAGDAWLAGFLNHLVVANVGAEWPWEQVVAACKSGNEVAGRSLAFQGATSWTRPSKA